MNAKNAISFLIGLISTGIIYVSIVFVYTYSIFSFSGQTWNEKANVDAFNFYGALIIILLTAYIIVRKFKSNQRPLAFGIVLPLILALFIFFKLAQVYYFNITSYQAFDKTTWLRSEFKPFAMTKTLMKNNFLMRKSKLEILQLLGIPGDTLKNDKIDCVKYWTDYDAWHLRVYFKRDTVIEAYLYQVGLDL